MIDYQAAFTKLSLIGQEHILKWWDDLSEREKNELLAEIDILDTALFLDQKSLIGQKKDLRQEISPLDKVSMYGDIESALIGRNAIKEGYVGAIIVAGGQGTRLGFPHPKGCFPITKVKKKSLFQLVTEKMLACGNRVQKQLHMAIMTSQDNDFETNKFFKDNAYFGAKEEQVQFFCQPNLPFLSSEGNLLLKSKSTIAEGPDGNGSTLSAFIKSSLFSKWNMLGIRYALFTLIDNPLADPFDEELVGRLIQGKCDCVIKAIERKSHDEKVGLIVQEEGKTKVIEYTEFPDALKLQREGDELLFKAANISLFCLSMGFIERIGSQSLPLHKSWKQADLLGPTEIWKFERFIFDMLPFAKNIDTVMYPRDICFSPLKNAFGEGSPETVQNDLIRSDQRVLRELFQRDIPSNIEEIAQRYYYPTDELKDTVVLNNNLSYLS